MVRDTGIIVADTEVEEREIKPEILTRGSIEMTVLYKCDYTDIYWAML